MEVPLLNTDSIEWRQVYVPSSSSPSTADRSRCKASSSYSVIGNPPSYLIWKTSKARPNYLEIIELCFQKQMPRIGLRFIFPDALFPFAFICKDVNELTYKHQLVLYALTISGVAYLIRIRDKFDYGASANLLPNEFIECNIYSFPHNGEINAVTATLGYLLIGKIYFVGFWFELRDDGGFLRNILSRYDFMIMLAAIQDLVISKVKQRELLFVLHSDGSFRIWDLISHGKVFDHAITIPAWTGSDFVRLWIGESNENGTIPLAVLHRQNTNVSSETIFLNGLHCNMGNRMSLTLGPWSRSISLEEGGLIDVKLVSNEVWILKEDGLIQQEVFGDANKTSINYYPLLESYVSDLLFQSSEHSCDDLLWLSLSLFSSAKEEITPFLSSVFLHALLLPGVLCVPVLRQTLGSHNTTFTDLDFGSLTVDGLKREILSVINYQGTNESPVSTLQRWNAFCSLFVKNWCKYNVACGLLLDPFTGGIGLVRNTLISVFRGLEDAECAIYGNVNESVYLVQTKLGFDNSSAGLDREILSEYFQCVRYISHQLGKASSAIIYDTLIRSAHISSVEVISHFQKILETGYSSSAASVLISETGFDIAWENEPLNRKNLRKFSMNMHLSLSALCHKAHSWSKVLDVVENYLKLLVPQKHVLNFDFKANIHFSGSAIVQTTCQIAKIKLESSFNVLLLLNYIARISGQIGMSQSDVLRINLDLIPMVQEIVMEWHIIHFLGTCPSQSPTIDDFGSHFSSLQIDSNPDRRLWISRLGKCDFSLAFILLLSMQNSSSELENLSFSHWPNPNSLVSLSRELTSWIIWGRTEGSPVFFSNAIHITAILLRHGQLNAAENLLMMLDMHLCEQRMFESLQAVDGLSSAIFHLIGCCHVAQSYRELNISTRNKKVGEAIRLFFRTASTEGSYNTLRSLLQEAGWLHIDLGFSTVAAWKLQYYQWVMQLFERYNLYDAAWQFALAALEQVDEALETINGSTGENIEESVTTLKGRLWSNAFKFALDHNKYHDAYCAIISNPDEESKNLCLRRFIIVLYDQGAIKILCDGELPLIGLEEKVERELIWKAERTNLFIKPNAFKVLYAFEMHRHNWCRAASFMYLYSMRLRAEASVKNRQLKSSTLQERLNALAAVVNALQLVHPAHAWIAAPFEETSLTEEIYPKKARITTQELCPRDAALPHELTSSYLDAEKLEEEYVLTAAEYFLSLADIKWTVHGNAKPTCELIDLLVESNLYDLAFTVILKFWKGSGLQREIERVFIAMALKCLLNEEIQLLHGKEHKISSLLLTSSEGDLVEDSPDAAAIITAAQEIPGGSHWERLELYLEKYKTFHPRLPLVVSRTLLSADSQIELPIWLIQHFTGCNNGIDVGVGLSGPALLFNVYVEYGRYAEAVKLIMDYLASVVNGEMQGSVALSGVWVPYNSIERLLWALDESESKLELEQLKGILQGALVKHLN
ncbi:hypothetical protein M569_07685 [Genlisea aurea]|uniref:Uncharacterized protein n=1 Tax=Genlisea aurea TaxID=192259 RepID=S8E472_9LAMI|nr:hypothetical protein M569_07685 [Genlisea aurea]